MSLNIDVKSGIEQKSFRGGLASKCDPGWCQDGGRGEVYLEDRRLGRKEEKKKGKRKVRKLGGKEGK